MPAKDPVTVRVQVYLTDPRVIAALNREAKATKQPLSQAAGRAIARGLKKSLPADPDNRLLQLDRHIRDHVRSASRDMQVMQEVQVETLRELFQRLPEVASDRDPIAQAAADRRVERVLDRVAERMVRGKPANGPDEAPASLQAAE